MSAFQGPCWAPPGKSTLRLVCHRKAFPLSSVSNWLPTSWQVVVASVLGDQQFDLGITPPSFPVVQSMSRVVGLEWPHLDATLLPCYVTLGEPINLPHDNCQGT